MQHTDSLRRIHAAGKRSEETCFCQEEKEEHAGRNLVSATGNICNQCWNYAKLCGKKYTCARAYRKKLDYIRNLHKNQDYVQLEIVFGRYTDMMNKCLKYDEIFEADPELLDIYIQYLEKTGRVGFMEKVKKYV